MKLFILFLFINKITCWNFIPYKKLSKPKIHVNPWNNKQFCNKKYISITPGGIYGFYSLGITSYIIDNYNMSNYSFLGASAGAWNSLVCCYKYDNKKFIDKLLNNSLLDNSNSISSLQYNIRDYLLKNYEKNDFDFDKLNICITEFNSIIFQPMIINNFTSLENAIDCCIVSSHIPYVTSNEFIKFFNNKIVFDGGFLEFPPKSLYSHIIISPSKYNFQMIGNMFINLFNKNITSAAAKKLYIKGYNDAKNDKKNLDYIFNPENEYLNIEENEFELE